MGDREKGQGEDRGRKENDLHLWKEISFLAQVLAPSTASPGSLTERQSRGERKRGKCPPPTYTLGLSPSVALNGMAICAGSTEREPPAGVTQQAQRGNGATPSAPGIRRLGFWSTCYSCHKPELCSLLKWLAPQLFENPRGLGDK